MDTSNWLSALRLFLEYPVLILATFVIAGAASWLAWSLRGHWVKGAIEARDQRLQLAEDQYKNVSSQLADVTSRAAALERQIAELRNSLSPVAHVEHLARSNTEFQQALTSLADSTSALGHTLTFGAGSFHVTVKPIATGSSG